MLPSLITETCCRNSEACSDGEHKVKLVQEGAPSLSSLSSLQPPPSLEEAPRKAELGTSLFLAAAVSCFSWLGPRKENLLRTRLAAAILKPGGQVGCGYLEQDHQRVMVDPMLLIV